MHSDPSSPSAVDPSELRQICETTARLAGGIARGGFGGALDVRLKADASHVTEIDVAAERAVIEYLRENRPQDGIIGEELAAQRSEEDSSLNAAVWLPDQAPPRVYWVIDPIDGTRNYINGIPLFASSVAVMVDGMPVAGAIYEPMRDLMMSASSAEGSFSNGSPIRIERDATQGQLQWLVAIPSQRYGQWHTLTKEWIENLIVRNLGSATLHLAMVAAGQLDAALMTKCKLWDIAAGWVIVTAAGGAMTHPDGKAIFPLDMVKYASESLASLAARPDVHAKLVGRKIT